ERSQAFFATLMTARSLIAFDWPNTGLSGATDDFALASLASAARSVLDHLGITTCDVAAMTNTGTVGLELARTMTGRINKLVLVRPRPVGSSPRTPYGDAIGDLAERDFPAFVDLIALRNYGFTSRAQDYSNQFRKQWAQDSFLKFCEAVESFDWRTIA